MEGGDGREEGGGVGGGGDADVGEERGLQERQHQIVRQISLTRYLVRQVLQPQLSQPPVDRYRSITFITFHIIHSQHIPFHPITFIPSHSLHSIIHQPHSTSFIPHHSLSVKGKGDPRRKRRDEPVRGYEGTKETMMRREGKSRRLEGISRWIAHNDDDILFLSLS